MLQIGLDIKKKIDEDNQKIKEALDPTQFILNKTIASLLEEIESLQKICPHEYKNGRCVYCYKEETED